MERIRTETNTYRVLLEDDRAVVIDVTDFPLNEQLRINCTLLTVMGKSQDFFSNMRSKHDLFFFGCCRRFKAECLYCRLMRMRQLVITHRRIAGSIRDWHMRSGAVYEKVSCFTIHSDKASPYLRKY